VNRRRDGSLGCTCYVTGSFVFTGTIPRQLLNQITGRPTLIFCYYILLLHNLFPTKPTTKMMSATQYTKVPSIESDRTTAHDEALLHAGEKGGAQHKLDDKSSWKRRYLPWIAHSVLLVFYLSVTVYVVNVRNEARRIHESNNFGCIDGVEGSNPWRKFPPSAFFEVLASITGGVGVLR
jgi:hypothetical protein